MKARFRPALVRRALDFRKPGYRTFIASSKVFAASNTVSQEPALNIRWLDSRLYQKLDLFEAATGRPRMSAYALRLACKCEQCVDRSDSQKKFSIADIPGSIAIRDVSHQDDGSFQIRWKNDVPGFGSDHVSSFHYDNLSDKIDQPQGEYSLPIYGRALRLWDSSSFNIQRNTISYNDYMSSDEAFARALDDIWTTGLIFVSDVPSDPSSVQKLAERIALVRNTFYGTTWDVRSKPNAENVAYTSRYLGYHMDLLYMKEAPGLQLLHCIENTCRGGESFFADTFTAADLLLNGNATHFDVLENLRIRYAYHNGEHCFADGKLVFSKDTGNGTRIKRAHHSDRQAGAVNPRMQSIQRVYWSPPFVSSQMHKPAAAMVRITSKQYTNKQCLAALKAFQTTLEQPKLRVETKLPPGTCAIFDNLRVVHAREAFDTNSGHRWLRGAYIDWQEYLSRANSLVQMMPRVELVRRDEKPQAPDPRTWDPSPSEPDFEDSEQISDVPKPDRSVVMDSNFRGPTFKDLSKPV